MDGDIFDPETIMGEKIMFDINEQIKKWRCALAQSEAFSKSDVDELESHLREEIERLIALKLSGAVRYFNHGKERIFVRTKAIIGRKVQQCHPPKSVHVVNSILDAFKKGTRNVAEFWLTVKNRLILIRYYAVRDGNGAYLGCLEVTQDITDIKKFV